MVHEGPVTTLSLRRGNRGQTGDAKGQRRVSWRGISAGIKG